MAIIQHTLNEGEKQFWVIRGTIRATSIYDIASLFEADVDSKDPIYTKIILKDLSQEDDLVKFLEEAQKKTPIS